MNIDFQLIKFYNNENFDLSNLERYIDYSKNHNQNDINTIITLVNNNVDNVINKLTEEEISIVEPMILNLIKEKYYIANNLSRYIDYYLKNYNSSSSQSLSSKDIINTINPNLEYGFYENSEATDITKDTLMIVNKHYKIDTNYEPSNLITIEPEYGYANKIRADIYEEFKKMYNAAKNDNVSLFIASPFRNYYEQKALYDSYVSRDGVKNADTYSARPGYSEHHTGLAVDLIPYRDLDLDTFESSAGFTWMQDNAYKYGFILRYPAGKEYITGYMYEPWHYRYVGVEAAKVIRNENITFEEYYEYYVKK